MLLWIISFALFVILFVAPVVVWSEFSEEKQNRRLMRRLTLTVDPDRVGAVTTLLVQKRKSETGVAGTVKTALAGRGSQTFQFAIVTVVVAGIGFVLGRQLEWILGPTAPLIAAMLSAVICWSFRSRQQNKRLTAMEEQFPDALDFLARSVRAGNAFSTGLELLAAEVAEPLKSEFLKVTREMALGANMEDALHGLVERVALFEVRFFVAAVLVQRETGGNLSEVLGKLAGAVRERLRLRGQVKAASGQGRLTARVLTCLPVVTMVMLELISPDYIGAMINDPVGRNLLAAAVVSLLLGHLVMKRLIRIEV